MGNPVRMARAQLDLTQQTLAQEAGVDLSTIVRAEKGLKLSPLSQARIARALGRLVEELFPEQVAS